MLRHTTFRNNFFISHALACPCVCHGILLTACLLNFFLVIICCGILPCMLRHAWFYLFWFLPHAATYTLVCSGILVSAKSSVSLHAATSSTPCYSMCCLSSFSLLLNFFWLLFYFDTWFITYKTQSNVKESKMIIINKITKYKGLKKNNFNPIK